MKWLRTIRETGGSRNLNLPMQLTRALALPIGGVIQLEWNQEEGTVLLRPIPSLNLTSFAGIPEAEQGQVPYSPAVLRLLLQANMEHLN